MPVLFFFTGLTDLYHTPDDDYETINVPGTVKAIDFAEAAIERLVNLPQRPTYAKTNADPHGDGTGGGGGGSMAYLGVVPDYGDSSGNGLRLTDINADSPAAIGGLEPGDVIIKFGTIDVEGIEGLAVALREYKAGQTVEVVVRRGEKKKTVKVTLAAPRSGR